MKKVLTLTWINVISLNCYSVWNFNSKKAKWSKRVCSLEGKWSKFNKTTALSWIKWVGGGLQLPGRATNKTQAGVQVAIRYSSVVCLDFRRQIGKAVDLAVSCLTAWWKQIYLIFLVLSAVSANETDLNRVCRWACRLVYACEIPTAFNVLASRGLIH